MTNTVTPPPHIWVHADTPNRINAGRELVDTLQSTTPDLQAVFSAPDGRDIQGQNGIVTPQTALGVITDTNNTPLCLWLCNNVENAIFAACHRAGVPVMMHIDDIHPIRGRSWLWRQTTGRSLLRHVQHVFVTSDLFVPTLRGIGVSPNRTQVLGPLLTSGSYTAGFVRAERETLQSLLAVRPVIFAPMTPTKEVKTLLAGFAQVQRGAHRALLILGTDGGNYTDGALAACHDAGFKTAVRSVEGEPTDTTQVFVADDPDEYGLWYSLATVSVFGGSFSGTRTDDPMRAAAAGSAVICGPNIATHAPAFDRLAQWNAVKQVTTPANLGPAIKDLLAPDIQATHAHAGWQALSEGADTMGKILDKMAETLNLTLRGDD